MSSYSMFDELPLSTDEVMYILITPFIVSLWCIQKQKPLTHTHTHREGEKTAVVID